MTGSWKTTPIDRSDLAEKHATPSHIVVTCCRRCCTDHSDLTQAPCRFHPSDNDPHHAFLTTRPSEAVNRDRDPDCGFESTHGSNHDSKDGRLTVISVSRAGQEMMCGDADPQRPVRRRPATADSGGTPVGLALHQPYRLQVNRGQWGHSPRTAPYKPAAQRPAPVIPASSAAP
mgnify:CR=1 FL=1